METYYYFTMPARFAVVERSERRDSRPRLSKRPHECVNTAEERPFWLRKLRISSLNNYKFIIIIIGWKVFGSSGTRARTSPTGASTA